MGEVRDRDTRTSMKRGIYGDRHAIGVSYGERR